jgi:biopolymer transport protein ExbB
MVDQLTGNSAILGQLWHYVVLSGGLLAVMPILLIITLAVALERFWLLKRMLRTGKAIQKGLRNVGHGDVEGLRTMARTYSKTLQGHLIATAVASRGESADEMDGHLEEEIMESVPRISRMMWVLDTSVTIAPLLGLFGTIIGMIQAFNVLSAHGGPAEVTGGIADALVSTGAGLLIAIIAVYFMNYLGTLNRQIIHQLELIKLALVNRLQGGGVIHESIGGGSGMGVTRQTVSQPYAATAGV